MDSQFFINGVEIILSPDTVIAVTYQSNNIGELQKRQGSYTNTFEVPMVDQNAQALEHSNLMTSATLYPYKILTGTLIQDGIEVFTDGQVKIVSIQNNIAKINIVAGNVDLSKAIGDLIVGDLFTDDIVYPWTLENVYNSRDKSKYYIYPVIDWRIDLNTMFSSPSIDVRQLLPCALMTEVFNRLENYTGYTFTGDYINSEDHKNMILTPSDFSRNPDFYEDEKTGLSAIGSITPGVGGLPPDIDYVWTQTFEIAQGAATEQHDANPVYEGYYLGNQGGFNIPLGSYFPPTDNVGTLKFAARLYLVWKKKIGEDYGIGQQPQSRNYQYITRIKKGGTTVAEISSDIINTSFFDPFEVVVDIDTGEIVLDSGNQYFVQIEFRIQQHSNIQTTFAVSGFQNLFTHLPTDSITYEQDIRFRDLFRMKVKDVFYDILNLRGLIIQTNSYTKEVQFNQFNDLIKNKSIARDWTEKIDINTNVLSFTFGKYSQRNNLLFKENSEVTQGLGDFYFNVNDENLDAESNAVQIKHPATEETGRYLGENIPTIEGIDDLNKWQKPEHRILQLNNQSTQYNVSFEDGSSTLNSNTNIPFCDFVGFEELVPNYYNALTNILDNTKALGLVFNLTPVDIQELDFTIPIFLNVPEMDVNGYFYINKISNYSKGKTSCELIRL